MDGGPESHHVAGAGAGAGARSHSTDLPGSSRDPLAAEQSATGNLPAALIPSQVCSWIGFWGRRE